jgi:hypothetical protein
MPRRARIHGAASGGKRASTSTLPEPAAAITAWILGPLSGIASTKVGMFLAARPAASGS